MAGSEGEGPAAPLVKETTTAAFREDVLTDSLRQPVLVDFWAPWCGPCRALAPTIDKIADQFSGRVKVGKLNTDDNVQNATNETAYAATDRGTCIANHDTIFCNPTHLAGDS